MRLSDYPRPIHGREIIYVSAWPKPRWPDQGDVYTFKVSANHSAHIPELREAIASFLIAEALRGHE